MPRRAPKQVIYSDSLQKKYRCTLTEPEGKNFDSSFHPHLTPKEMLRLGVFGGAYFIGVPKAVPSDLPASWFSGVLLSQSGKKEKQYNFFRVSASQPLAVWQQKGWIYKDDPHGWFQWYCRYYMGRRIAGEDERQIRRWRNMRRHMMQIRRHCKRGNLICRPRQRQALLHWAYDTTTM